MFTVFQDNMISHIISFRNCAEATWAC
jgi:hypothetical protein